MKTRLTFLSLLFYFNQYSYSQELCPPSSINVFGGDQENIVSWGEPVGNIGCGDYAVNELPYVHQGNNTGTGDNWPVSGSQGEDVAYTLNVGQATKFDITGLKLFKNGREVEITGVLSSSFGKSSESQKPVKYLITYSKSHGRLLVKTFNEKL